MNINRKIFSLLLATAFITLLIVISISPSFKPQQASASGTSGAPMPSCIPPNCAGGNEWFAAPNGSSTGDGTINNPWDIATALNMTTVIQPGDILWLRGGTYTLATSLRSNLNGTIDKPIVIRNYNEEKAVLTGTGNYTSNYNIIFIAGNYTWLWGLEFTDIGTKRLITDPNLDYWGIIAAPGKMDAVANQQGAPGCTSCGTGTRLVNLIVHDLVTGIGLWAGGDNIEAYGNISFNNGFDVSGNNDPAQNRPHGHGFYIQNTPNSSSRWLQDNLSFNNFNNDAQVYGSSAVSISNVFIDGNIMWNASAPTGFKSGSNFVLYGGANTGNVHFTNNMTYASFGAPINVRLGNTGYSELDVEVTNNFFANSIDISNWSSVLFTGNTAILRDDGTHYFPPTTATTLNWDYNKYYSNPVDVWGDLTINYVGQTFSQWQSKGMDAHGSYSNVIPSDPKVFIRPNKYEYGSRAYMAIYNFGLNPTVSVDLTGAKLTDGSSYKIINAQNFTDPKTFEGIYSAANPTISLPMTGWAAPTMPYGGTVSIASTFPEFGVFIIKATASSTPIPPPPPTATTTYTLTVTPLGTGSGTVSGTGISCGADCTETVESGTVITLTASPSSNSNFSGWSNDCGSNATCAITVTATTSVSATFTLIPDVIPPSVPANLTANAPDSTKVNLSWSASTDNVSVMGYEVFRNGVLIGGPTITSFVDTAVTPGSTYTYTVLAYDAAGNASLQSSPVSVDVPPAATAAVSITSYKVSQKTASTTTIVWTTNVPSTGEISYGKTSQLGSTVIDSTSSTSHTKTITGLSKSTKYYYKIKAQNSSSSYSTPVSSFKTAGR